MILCMNWIVRGFRKYQKPLLVTCVSTDDPALDVNAHVNCYLERTKEFRSDKDLQLFISWQTKRPVGRQTLSRWLKLVLEMAGIDTSEFGSHSYRGAGLAKAKEKCASIHQIVAAGNWKNVKTFSRHYDAPIQKKS